MGSDWDQILDEILDESFDCSNLVPLGMPTDTAIDPKINTELCCPSLFHIGIVKPRAQILEIVKGMRIHAPAGMSLHSEHLTDAIELTIKQKEA
jgi:hypothetical protein